MYFLGCLQSAIVALDESHLVAVHALERHKLGGKVVAVHRLLGSFARRTRQQTVTAARLAGECGRCGLKWWREKQMCVIHLVLVYKQSDRK